jgi:heme exporter protein A
VGGDRRWPLAGLPDKVGSMGEALFAHRFTGSALACRRAERLVFRGLDFTLGAGEALVLRGPNGSGKSSLLRIMAGLAQAAAGRLEWDGADIAQDRWTHAARLAFVGHLDAIKPALTVAENLSFWARLRWAPHETRTNGAIAATVAATLERLALARLAAMPARLLSAGQRRRLALARLLVAPATLWLLDEPSVGLDEEALRGLESMLAEHRRSGGMVALATHAEIALAGACTLRLDGFAATARVADPIAAEAIY